MAVPASGVALSVATGAMTLPDPATLEPRALRLYRTAMALLVGWSTYDALSETSEGFSLPPAARAGLSVAATAGTAAFIERFERNDAQFHRWLGRRGVRHPRRFSAIASTVVSLGVIALAERTRASAADFDEIETQELPLDAGLQAILERILASTEEHSAAALRDQLPLARYVRYDDDQVVGYLDIVLDEHAVPQRAVPRDFVFPVQAVFEHGGQGYAIRIGVTAGLMSEVLVQPDDPDDVELPPSWPSADQVDLRHDRDVR